MKYDQAGTYELTYKAVDECGNESTQKRTVIVTPLPTYKTVLFTDGTFIINEKSTDRESNIAQYGAVVREYAPLDTNNLYRFGSGNDREWLEKTPEIKHLKFGSEVAPYSLAFWMQATALEDIDWTNFDGSKVTTMRAFVAGTNITEFEPPEMPLCTSIQYLCRGSEQLKKADFSNMKSRLILITQDAFQGCYGLTEVNLVGLAGNVNSCERMFANTANDGKGNMQIQTIYSDGKLQFWQATSSTNMFRSCTSLVGGEGTAFDSNVTNKDWARIDNPPDEKGYFTAR